MMYFCLWACKTWPFWPIQYWLSTKLSWKCRRFRCCQQLVLKTCLRVFPTRQPDTADVSATSCDVEFFFSVSYVMSLLNCRHVVVVSTHLSCLLCAILFSCNLWYSRKSTRVLVRVMRQNFGSGNINISPIEKCAHLKPLDIFTTRKPWAPSTTPSPAAHCPPAPIPTW
jgi:hypothetical protein